MRIVVTRVRNFVFVLENDNFFHVGFGICHRCGNSLDPYYSEMILRLQENKLLSSDFEALCCICWRNKEEDRINQRVNSIKKFEEVLRNVL